MTTASSLPTSSLDLGQGFGLRGKRVLITGGSRGIGAATVRLLSELGAHVAFTYLNHGEAAESLLQEAEDRGFERIALKADQRSQNDAKRAVEKVHEAWGGLDAFVGNAGIWLPTPAEAFDPSKLEEILETNLTGLFRWNAEVIPLLKKSYGGSLVLLSSTAGQRGEAGYGAYAATKGAVISLVKSLATELGPSKIRVNAVAPGWVDTDLSAPALRNDPAQRAKVEALFPLGHIPSAGDLAGPIAFLLSDWAFSISGEVLNVNGGTVLCG
jgi:3-oxoacyl-[acyl-carrier protein] reductase